MEPQINVLTEFEKPDVAYASFWNRLWALLIDGLILLPLLILDIFNKTTFKSIAAIILVAAVGILYKPFFEFKYGATVGKKALGILVVNKDLQNLDLRAAILRNIFDVGERLFTLILTIVVFTLPAFKNISSLDQFTILQSTLISTNWYVFIPFIITLVEICFLLTDKQKRSLHD